MNTEDTSIFEPLMVKHDTHQPGDSIDPTVAAIAASVSSNVLSQQQRVLQSIETTSIPQVVNVVDCILLTRSHSATILNTKNDVTHVFHQESNSPNHMSHVPSIRSRFSYEYEGDDDVASFDAQLSPTDSTQLQELISSRLDTTILLEKQTNTTVLDKIDRKLTKATVYLRDQLKNTLLLSKSTYSSNDEQTQFSSFHSSTRESSTFVSMDQPLTPPLQSPMSDQSRHNMPFFASSSRRSLSKSEEASPNPHVIPHDLNTRYASLYLDDEYSTEPFTNRDRKLLHFKKKRSKSSSVLKLPESIKKVLR